MNWDQVEGKWKQYSGKAREKWGKLTDSDLEVVKGKRDQLIGRIQERYGIAKDAAQSQVDEFVNSLQDDSASEETQTTNAGDRRSKSHTAGRK
jgi:uncharacterized protein YjbJ (UPF0337 family)